MARHGRRTFLRLSLGGGAGVLLGCEGTLEALPRGPRSADAGEPPLGDSGPPFVPADAGLDTTPPDGGARPPAPRDAGSRPVDAGRSPTDAGPPRIDGGCPDSRVVTLHDTHAQALYFDGGYGPTTGVITVDQMVAGARVELEFWHGHGGVSHRFALEPSDLDALTRGERVTVSTTEVDGHSHMLFVDPVDPRWSAGSDREVMVC